MICSINEIKSIIIAASKGAGLSFSSARSLSSASVWMVQRGYDGVNGVFLALESQKKKEIIVTFKNKQMRVFSPVQAANGGSAIMDFLIVEKPNSKVELLNVDVPVLMVGFAGMIAESYNVQILIDFFDGSKVTIEGDKLFVNGTIPLKEANMNISINERAKIKQDLGLKVKKKSLFVSFQSWEKLQELAALTYVEVTNLSHKSGAGAGLIDND